MYLMENKNTYLECLSRGKKFKKNMKNGSLILRLFVKTSKYVDLLAFQANSRAFPDYTFFWILQQCVHSGPVFHSYNVTKILMKHTVFPIIVEPPSNKSRSNFASFFNKGRTLPVKNNYLEKLCSHKRRSP